ncbi:hypothetical protein AB0D97_18610 [Streptomyces roseus]|uniref:hypothetical protein n=1 Tax=Streptomyces roseus TaxID=66430 RepID=UPI0033D6DF21
MTALDAVVEARVREASGGVHASGVTGGGSPVDRVTDPVTIRTDHHIALHDIL